MARLTDDELISICRREEMVAQQWQDAELLATREKALNYYDRTGPDFTHEEGESGAVTSEVADTIESVMPGMMRVFASGEEIAEFTPMEQEDEQAAKEATQYVPHVLMRENDGFRIIYWFCKDVLLYRLATLHVDVDEVEKTRKDVVEGATEEEMAALEEKAMDEGATEVVFDVEPAGMRTMVVDPETGQPIPLDEPVEIYSGTVAVTRKKKRVIPDNVAPEDLLVSPSDVRDIDEASFAGYRKEVTASDLRVLGLTQEQIDGLSADRRSSPEEDQRQGGLSFNDTRKDDQRRLWLVVAYVKADADGDGISEMLRVVYAHGGGKSVSGALVQKTEWEEDEAPITIGSAILMSHTIIGRSLADQTIDLQDQGTAITRAMLDNTYQVVRPRPMINGRVNINSVLDMTPGMPITVDNNSNPNENIGFLQVPPIMDKALAVLGYLENKRDQRTGTSRLGNNMDDDALEDASKMTKGGTQILRSASQERQGLMVQTLANTSLVRFYRHIYRAIKRCATGPIKYPVKGEWKTCDPTKWPDDMHLIVSVGAGTGDEQMAQQNLVMVGAAQEKLALAQGGTNGPLTLEHMMNTGRKLAEAVGYRATSQFFPSEKDMEQWRLKKSTEPPPVDPEMAKVQAKAAADQAQLQADNALAQARLAAETQQKREAAAIDMQLAREKAAQELQIAREKAALDMQIAREKAALDAQLKARELEQEAVLGAMEIKEKAKVQGAAQQREQQVSE